MNQIWLVWLIEEGDETPQVARSSRPLAREWCEKHAKEHQLSAITWTVADVDYCEDGKAVTDMGYQVGYMIESIPFM